MAETLGPYARSGLFRQIHRRWFPGGCYDGRRDLLDLVAPNGPVYQAGTLSANPVGMRAGLATLQKAERVNVWEQLEAKTAQFCGWLNTQFSERALPFELTQYASLFWLRGRTDAPIRSIAQIPAEHGAKFARIFHAALANGVYLAPSGYEVGFISLAHTDALLERAAQTLLEAVIAAQA